MMDDDSLINGVIDTIDSANQYRLRLEELLSALKDTQNQVKQSAHASEKRLTEYFGDLKLQLVSTLDDRLDFLIKQVKDIESTALTPLNQCEDIINQNVNSANEVLKQGKELLANEPLENPVSMKEYRKRADEVGLGNLPEVPPLNEVACIYCETPEVLRQQLLTDVRDYGRVIPRAPVQITNISERPGSLVIKWAQIEDEETPEMSEFSIQYCRGQDITSPDVTVHNVKVGTASSYTLKHVLPMTTYTFCVRGRPEQIETWSPWSVPQSAITTLPHHAWDNTSSSFAVSNEKRIGERLKSEGSTSLFSSGKSYTCGQSIVFKVLEVGSLQANGGRQEEGIALTASNTTDSLLTTGCVFVSATGEVYLDGQEKLTKLPPFKRGSVLTFETEVLSSGKVRLSIEVDGKIVTFDWTVENPANVNAGLFSAMATAAINDIDLYFIMKFSEQGWKIAVE